MIIGAGAIGVTFAAELQRAGCRVTVVARGAQLQAARNGGIRYVRPDGAEHLAAEVAGSAEEVALTAGDVLVLATKTQDAAAAISEWAGRPVAGADGRHSPAGATLPLLTTQNGLETERIALRRFRTVIAGVLGLPATYVEPGVVVAPGAPFVGYAWIGAYPDRDDPQAARIAADLSRANIAALALANISDFKRGKLLVSSAFVLDALYAPSPLRDRAAALLQDEARAIFAATGQGVAALGLQNGRTRRDDGKPDSPAPPTFEIRPVAGYEHAGTSTRQSLARAGSIETDYLNGEVVLQARLAGLAAPANEAVTRRIQVAAAEGIAPGQLGDADLAATFPQLSDPPAQTNDVLIDPVSLHRRLRGLLPPLVLDVRWKLGDPEGRLHYRHSHIPTAVYVDLDTELASGPSAKLGRHPLPELDALQESARRWGLSDGQAVVVYDDNGGMSAARAWWLLRWAGVKDVRILDGSLGAWVSSQLPTESGELRIPAGDVHLEAGHLPVLDPDRAAELAERGILLDARAPERYRGEHEPVDPRAGHIPGAVSSPTSDNLDGDGRFRDAEELRTRFAALGARPDREIGVYCGSGVTAAHEIAALRIAGIDAALFPGSWSAWSSDPHRPVAVGALPS